MSRFDENLLGQPTHSPSDEETVSLLIQTIHEVLEAPLRPSDRRRLAESAVAALRRAGFVGPTSQGLVQAIRRHRDEIHEANDRWPDAGDGKPQITTADTNLWRRALVEDGEAWERTIDRELATARSLLRDLEEAAERLDLALHARSGKPGNPEVGRWLSRLRRALAAVAQARKDGGWPA